MYASKQPYPGRLRLRFEQLKRNPQGLHHVGNAMRAVNGVVSVDTSPITGGILIQYHAALGASDKFWNDIDVILLAHHLHHAPASIECPQATTPASALGRRLVSGLAGVLVDKLLERSAVVLVAALL